jgi:hypothetical protein
MSDQTKLQAIEDAIASGLTEFTFDGATSKYRSLVEMREIRDEIKASLGHVAPQNNTWVSSFDKGYR